MEMIRTLKNIKRLAWMATLGWIINFWAIYKRKNSEQDIKELRLRKKKKILEMNEMIKDVPSRKEAKNVKKIAFFHPYCDAGGGGERVLWTAMQAMQDQYPDMEFIVYTGDINVKKEAILRKVKERFDKTFEKNIRFVYLKMRCWVEAKRYPRLTLLGQSIGSIFLAIEALYRFSPDILIDTMGYAFTYPVFKLLGGCQIVAYVHYPMITSEMIRHVEKRESSYNHAQWISRHPLLTRIKLIYYKLFAKLYGFAGSFCDLIMVNSTWTLNHINQLWNMKRLTTVVYPPCDTISLQNLSLDRHDQIILSIAQFRPEKDHILQIRAFYDLIHRYPRHNNVKLYLIGSTRDKEDDDRVKQLRTLVQKLELGNLVEFKINISYDELRVYLSKAMIGLHTMFNEHFGIGIVEYMAAGLIPLVHDSAGPKMDIVIRHKGKPTGFRAITIGEYADKLHQILSLTSSERRSIQENARSFACSYFSEENFYLHYIDSLVQSPFIDLYPSTTLTKYLH